MNARWTSGLGVVGAALALAGSALAADPAPSLPSGWSHAAVNVVGPKGQPHTIVFDRGTITALGSQTLTLKELDGSLVTIAVASNATVIVNGRPASFADLQPGYTATTRGVDGAPVIRVQSTAPPARPVITHGRVSAVGPSSLTLRQQDGTIVTVAIAPDATVRVNGRPAALSDIHPGFAATTSAPGNLPANRVQSTGRRP